MKKYIELIRVKHWIKNVLLFVPMITAKLVSWDNIFMCLLGFLSFSLASSFVYIINDIKDIEKDKLHERKKNRPLPSGRIKKNVAIVIAIVLLALSFTITIIIKKSFFNQTTYCLLAYVIINISYSMGLKNIAIIDLALLTSGFIIRVYYGAALVNVDVSNWLFLTILSASLFCGIGKRKKELVNSKKSRTVLKEYNESYLEKFEYVTLSLTMVFYSLWTIEQKTNYLVYTVPLLLIIFMKYSLLIEKNNEGDPTTILYSDKLLLSLCGLYGCIIILLLVVIK